MRAARSLLAAPEANVGLFAFLLNFPWEFLQVPLYAAMPQTSHWEAIKVCTRAALGDAVTMLLAYAIVAVAVRDRHWIRRPTARQLAGLVAVGVAVTVVVERLALAGAWFGGWAYAPAMPVVPLLDVGLAPLSQWVLLPPLVVLIVRRQLAGQASRVES